METFLYKYISTATTTTITASEGTLHSITVGETAAGTITVSDMTGTIAVLKTSIGEGTYTFDVAFDGYLSIVTGATSKITVSYKV